MPRPATCSEDELERCVATLAYIVVRHGPVYAPLFDRMERELAEMRRRGDPADRARRFLEARTIDVAGRDACLMNHNANAPAGGGKLTPA